MRYFRTLGMAALALCLSSLAVSAQQGISLSQLPLAVLPLVGTEIIPVDQINIASPTGRSTRQATVSQLLAGGAVLPANNSANALTFTTPNPTASTYDTTPIAAIFIAAPAQPTTRNFDSGIWVQTQAATTDKGRGVGINNLGAGDGLYIQTDGVGGTGFASLVTSLATNATAGVISTVLSNQVALNLRQETSLNPSAASASLLQVDANGSATEMVRLNSTVASQTGIIARMSGSNSAVLVVHDTMNNTLAQINGAGGILGSAFFVGASVTAGVSCSGSPTASFASISGIVTHC